MSNILPELRYTKQHEWVRIEENTAVIGISDYAQNAIGDVTFVELPAPAQEFKQGDELLVVESTKAASDVFAPVSGTIATVNSALEDQPELVNADPYGKGWMVKIHIGDASGLDTLMNAAQYAEYLEGDS